MATVVPSIGLKGLEGYKVQVEVQLLPGIEGVTIIGLPDAAVKESKDRVMSALFANGCEIPDKKIVINLSPSELRKTSPIFDLAMAIGVMKEAGDILEEIPKGAAFLGLLSLDGTIKSVEGIIPAILAAKKEGFNILYLPHVEHFPLKQLEGIEFRFVHSLQEVIASFCGQLTLFTSSTPKPPVFTHQSHEETSTYDKDFNYVLGHTQAKRAMEIAAAGGHNLFMSGPPGCGKSLLAETFPSILPSLTEESQLEVMSIYQLAGLSQSQFNQAPYRNPHHSASAVSLIGGGSNPKPGEVSLAHRGVLFLDEMAEFSKRTLDMLRQPMETGKVTISRVASTVTYPSRFILLGAINPCPCGYLGSRNFYCTCTPKQITQYKNRISGPIHDRMDILLQLQSVSLEEESTDGNETSAVIRSRVLAARERQYDRYQNEWLNGTVAPEQIVTSSPLDREQQKMLQQSASKQNWSTRVQMKMIRLARTISDLNGDDKVSSEALWEAMTLRRIQRGNEQKVVRR